MTDTDVRHHLSELASRFANTHVHRFEAMEPYAGGARASKALAKAFGHAPPPDLAALYAALDGLSLWWHISTHDRRVASTGSIELTPSDGVAAAIAPGRAALPDAVGTPFRFDTGAFGHATVADVTPTSTSLSLVGPDGAVASLPLSPLDYVATAVEVGGIAGWAFRAGDATRRLLDRYGDDRLAERAAAFVPTAVEKLAVPAAAAASALRFLPALDAAAAAGATVETAPPVPTPALRWAAARAGAPVPRDLLAFYEETNGVQVSGPDGAPGFRIEPLERVVGGPSGARSVGPAVTAATALGLPASSPLSDWLLLYQAEEQIAVVRFDTAQVATATRDGVRPIALSIGSFLEAAIAQRGAPAWFGSL